MNTQKKSIDDQVREWINNNIENCYSEKELLEDLEYGGCQSGMVSDLIYYSDTVAFYHAHQSEISDMLRETLESTGLSVSELFGDKWDNSDPLANDQFNQNLLAWFAFEETAFRIYSNKYE